MIFEKVYTHRVRKDTIVLVVAFTFSILPHYTNSYYSTNTKIICGTIVLTSKLTSVIISINFSVIKMELESSLQFLTYSYLNFGIPVLLAPSHRELCYTLLRSEPRSTPMHHCPYLHLTKFHQCCILAINNMHFMQWGLSRFCHTKV